MKDTLPPTPEQNFTPHMSEAEIAVLTRHIPAGGNVLEFGAGGSSLLFMSQGARSLTTVESDLGWIQKLAATPALKECLGQSWFPLHADIGPIKEWGYPAHKEPCQQWLNYHEQVWREIQAESVDLALIDGRFRVACTCQVLLRCSKDSLILAIHDFWNRPFYHDVLNFCDVLDKADTLAILQRKKDMDMRAVVKLLAQASYITA